MMSEIPIIEVYYDNDLRNWDEVIDAELARRGLLGKPCRVIAYPKQIKQVDLVALAINKAGVELHRVGPNHVGLCPLHTEKTPSFYIRNNRFKCFGCGEGGDSVDFIQRLYKCDLPEALRILGINSKRVTLKEKIKIKQRQRRKAERIQRERDLIFTLAILIRAAHKCSEYIHLLPCWTFYHDILARGSKEDKDEVIEGLKDFTTISRTYLFEPNFNYKNWVRSFIYGTQEGAGSNVRVKNFFR